MASPSPKGIEQLQTTLASIPKFRTSVFVQENDSIIEIRLTAEEQGRHIRVYVLSCPGPEGGIKFTSNHDSLLEAFETLTTLLPAAILFPESVQVDCVESQTVKLPQLTKSAWCEAFGHHDDSAENGDCAQSRLLILKNNFRKKLSGGPKGIKAWNADSRESQILIDWSHSQLAGAKLKGARFSFLNFSGANFDNADLTQVDFEGSNLSNATFRGANLTKAKLLRGNLTGADLTGACLHKAMMEGVKLVGTVLKDADVSNANMRCINFSGVDLSTVNATDTKLTWSKYDRTTKLPANLPHWESLEWNDAGRNPYIQSLAEKLEQDGIKSFDELMAQLRAQFDTGRLSKALSMLKKDRFQLFNEVREQKVIGIVKSQTDADLVYACSIASDGAYSCCTQNLRPCGGLKGEVCKHILVLVVGLARAEQLDLTRAVKWLLSSYEGTCKLDKETMTDVFLKYKNAEAGTIDWRPTETIPEDYYAF